MRAEANGQRVHGGLHPRTLERLGIPPNAVLDFSVNTNPYGPAPELLAALKAVRVEQYPDPAAWQARSALGRFLDADPERIALGNGAAELLWDLARLLLERGATVLLAEPTFGEFRAAAQACGARIAEQRACERADFVFDFSALAHELHAAGASLVYVCAPNTPAGTAADVHELVQFAEQCAPAWIALDQSFLSMSERAADLAVRLPDNVIAVRSLTKDQAVPGVRVGYLLAPPELVRALDAVRPAWPTSAAAQTVAETVPQTAPFLDWSRERWLAERRDLAAGVAALGYRVVPSSTGFFLIETGRAAAFAERLLVRQRVYVRACDSFGLPNFIRVCARSRDDNRRLLCALEAEMNEP